MKGASCSVEAWEILGLGEAARSQRASAGSLTAWATGYSEPRDPSSRLQALQPPPTNRPSLLGPLLVHGLDPALKRFQALLGRRLFPPVMPTLWTLAWASIAPAPVHGLRPALLGSQLLSGSADVELHSHDTRRLQRAAGDG